MLSCYGSNSPETELATEFLVRESGGELTRPWAKTRLWCVFPWDLQHWMNAKRPEEQSRADRLRILALCAEVCKLQTIPFSRNTEIVFASLTRELELDVSDAEAVENAAIDSLESRRSNWSLFYCDLENWDYVPFWLIEMCDLFGSVIEVYRVGSAEWHLARERFIESLFEDGRIERRVVLHAFSEVDQWREHSDSTMFIVEYWNDAARLNLLFQAADIVSVEPKMTKRKLRKLREFAKRIKLPESAVQEVLDQRAIGREPSAE